LSNESHHLTKYLFIIVLLFSLNSYAQDTTISADTVHIVHQNSSAKDSLVKRFALQHDTLARLKSFIPDSLQHRKDSASISNLKSEISNPISLFSLDTSRIPQSNIITERHSHGKETLFYIILGFLLLVGIFRAFYSKYLMNLFRVFFNTSLRQGQLTDILLQSRLSSLVFNAIFIFSAGIYVWLLLTHYNIIPSNEFVYLPLSIVLILCIYIVKYIVIKFIGWISGLNDAASQYIFIIFLINKIIAFILLPFIIFIAFGPASWLPGIILLSWLILATLFLVRYFRSYGNLQSQLQVSPFHFLIYLAAIEIIPLFLLYKSIFHLMTNNPLV
jgi:hypothetical protein